MSFAHLNLHPNIIKATSVCGYKDPTPVQRQSIPPILDKKDVVVSAPTGTGKTAAFVLPSLHHLSQAKPMKQTRILILTPTRELAAQITKAASLYGKFLQFKIVSLVGGMSYHHQIKDLSRGADIIVATPGRLLDHIERQRVDLSNIEMLVLDEADRMLDMGFIEDVEYIAKLTPNNRQTLLFSATVDNKLTTIVKHLLKNPVRIDLSDKKVTAPQIKQELYKANNTQHKSRLLKHFLNDANIYKAIIFSATKINADKLAYELRDEGFAAAALHGDLKQNVRNRTIEQLRQGKIQFLVATDVAARGIDIVDVTHVINYDLPRFCEDYVHRIGRTGRAGKSGTAISFVLPADTRHLQRIERYIGQRLKLIQNVDMGEAVPSKIKINRQERDFSQDQPSEHRERPKQRRSFERKKENRSSYRGQSNPFRNEERAKDSSSKNEGHPTKKKFSSFKDRRNKGKENGESSSGQQRPHHKKRFSNSNNKNKRFTNDRRSSKTNND